MADRVKYHTEHIPADTRRAVFMGNPYLDHMFAAITAMSGEIWSVRRRLNIVETLMDKKGTVSRADVEQYMPTKEEQDAWNAQRDNFINLVFDPFTRPGDIPYASSLEPNKGKP